MSIENKLLQQALDAMEYARQGKDGWPETFDNTVAVIRAHLAQPEQEPVAYMHPRGGFIHADHMGLVTGLELDTFTIPLYTAPPQRKPLTDEHIERLEALCIDPVDASGWGFLNRNRFARAVEAAHGIK